MMKSKLNREELAALEVGHTTVSQSLARIIVFCFLILISLVPMLQLFLDYRNPDQQSVPTFLRTLFNGNTSTLDGELSAVATIRQNNTQLLKGMEDFERQLEENSFYGINYWHLGSKHYLVLDMAMRRCIQGKSHGYFTGQIWII